MTNEEHNREKRSGEGMERRSRPAFVPSLRSEASCRELLGAFGSPLPCRTAFLWRFASPLTRP
jgi:hypothetical protein